MRKQAGCWRIRARCQGACPDRGAVVSAAVADGIRCDHFIAGERDAGRSGDLYLPGAARVSVVSRGEEAMIATGNDELRPDDRVLVLSHGNALDQFMKTLCPDGDCVAAFLKNSAVMNSAYQLFMKPVSQLLSIPAMAIRGFLFGLFMEESNRCVASLTPYRGPGSRSAGLRPRRTGRRPWAVLRENRYR